MAVKRYGVQNPNANTEVTLLTTNDPLLISVIATNKHASADADINVFVIPNGATQPSQYAYIAYNLQVNPGNSVETHRFAVNAGDTVKVSSSISDVSFTASGIPQTDVLPADEVQVFTNKTISGLSNTLTNIGNSSLVNDSFVLMGEDIELGETVSNLDYFQFDTSSTPSAAVGRLIWDDGEGTASLGLKGGNVNLQIGQEQVALCYNGTGSTISNGSVVYITGAQGQRPSVALADADTEATSSKVFGIATEDIANGAEGFVATFGIVNGINTSGFTAGQALWLSSTPGQLTNVKPVAPVHSVFIGYCLHVNASSGRIFVNPQNGYELEELHNVLISTPSNGQALTYDSATQLWKNTSVDSLPSQTGNSGKYLTTDGSVASWATVDALPSQSGNSGKYLTTNGTTASWAVLDLSTKADINSPTFTGTPSAPTASAGNNTTQIATTAFVGTAISNLINGAPGALDTLDELAQALGDDSNFASTITNTLALKAPLASPTFTGTVTVPTPSNSTDAATKQYVDDEIVYSENAPASPRVGTLWIESDVDVDTYKTQIFTRWSKTLSISETTFSGLSSGILLEYTVGYEQVYLNGILLVRGVDYTATDGLTVVLSDSAISGDIIEIISLNTLSIANVYTKSEIDLALENIDALPSQSGNSGEFLITNGTSASWSNTVTSNSNSTPAIIAKGTVSQSANIQEWQNNSSTVLASISSSGVFTAVSKSFDIDHPTKSGMRLRYGSLEGPENGVYLRGTSESYEIILPDYWNGLVHKDSITVQLTPKGNSQSLYVQQIVDNKIIVGGVEGEYFYLVQAERKDIDKLVVEY